MVITFFNTIREPGTYADLTGAHLTIIGPLAGSIPEPVTWTMLVLGFGVAGAAM